MSAIRTVRELGGAIRHARRQAGWTQHELAERVGVTRQWIVQLEQGGTNITFENLRSVCEALHLTMFLQPTTTHGDVVEPPKQHVTSKDTLLDEIITSHTYRPEGHV